MIDPISFIFAIAVLITSVIIHEVSHGYVAEHLGDPTARLAGRLTLNPLAHLDLVGSFIVPTITFFLGGFIFGWAKPVPYNPYNLRDPRTGGAIIAAAGPFANIIIALIFGLLIRFSTVLHLPDTFLPIAGLIVLLNIILAFFNLLPIPPLDGSKILFAVLPYRFHYIQEFLERYGLFVIFLLIIFLWRFLLPVVFFLFRLITGGGFF